MKKLSFFHTPFLFYTGSCKEHFTYEKREGYWLIVLFFVVSKDNFM